VGESGADRISSSRGHVVRPPACVGVDRGMDERCRGPTQGGSLCTGVVSVKALSKSPLPGGGWQLAVHGRVGASACYCTYCDSSRRVWKFRCARVRAWGLTSTTLFPCAKVPPVARKTWFQVKPPLRLPVCMRFVGAAMPFEAGVVSSVGARRVGQRRRDVCQSDLCSVLPFEILVPGVRATARRFLTT
jgi:hypothetical protein